MYKHTETLTFSHQMNTCMHTPPHRNTCTAGRQVSHEKLLAVQKQLETHPLSSFMMDEAAVRWRSPTSDKQGHHLRMER